MEKIFDLYNWKKNKSEEVMQQKWVVEILNNYQERKLDTDCRISKKNDCRKIFDKYFLSFSKYCLSIKLPNMGSQEYYQIKRVYYNPSI